VDPPSQRAIGVIRKYGINFHVIAQKIQFFSSLIGINIVIKIKTFTKFLLRPYQAGAET
jgi:hypothetical protein